MPITVPTAEREPGGVETREEQPTEKQGRTQTAASRGKPQAVEGPVLPVVLRNRRRTPWRAKADGSIRKMNGLYRHISEISTPNLEHAPRSEIWILCYCTRASSSDCLATRVYPPARPSLRPSRFPRMRHTLVPGRESCNCKVRSPARRWASSSHARGRCVLRRGYYPSVLAAGSADSPRRACGCRVGGEPLPVRAWRGQGDGKTRRGVLLAARCPLFADHHSPLAARTRAVPPLSTTST